jgi:hypothetical protein
MMTGWKAWGGEWGWCEHEHATWDEAAACAEATGRAMVVDASTVVFDEERGTVEFKALNRDVYATGGETVDLSGVIRRAGR